MIMFKINNQTQNVRKHIPMKGYMLILYCQVILNKVIVNHL